MKFIRSLTAGVCGAGLLAAAIAQQNPVKFELPQVGAQTPATQSAPAAQPGATATQPAAPATPAVKFTEAQMMEVYGYMLGVRMNLADLEFTPAQIEAMAKGMILAATGKQPTYDGQQIGPQLQELLQKKQQAFLTKIRNANLADTAAFFTKLKDNKNVKELGGTGLRYEILTEGKGAVAKPGQVARIHLIGAFINGQVFESTRAAPQGQTAEPVEVLVQDGANIPGIVEALKVMPTGSKWRLYVPPHLAFGDDGNGAIPPAATLIFEIELFEVKDAPPQPEEAKK
jgi:FKBP-type peptidyl-prolyl cis-trans isomerase FklB